jgi:hypothetical protein
VAHVSSSQLSVTEAINGSQSSPTTTTPSTNSATTTMGNKHGTNGRSSSSHRCPLLMLMHLTGGKRSCISPVGSSYRGVQEEADASTMLYSSNPNLGSAHVVFEVTHNLAPSVPITILITARSAQCVWPRIRSKMRFLLVSGGETGENLKFTSSVDGLGMV